MKNTTKIATDTRFFAALAVLFGGLVNFTISLSYDGLENDLLADNWGVPFAFFLTLSFGLGWLFEGFVEKLVLSKGRTIAVFAFIGIIFVHFVVSLLAFTQLGFLRYSIGACGQVLLSGFLFHFSAAHPDAIAKLQSLK